jgi:hypothetical protein
VQGGMTVAEFLARKTRTQKRGLVKAARGSVSSEAISAFLQGCIAQKTELAVVLGERTLLDVMTDEDRAAFTLARAGRVEKLQVVMICKKATWEARGTTFERDPKLSQKPASVARQPDLRPVSDPRPFLEKVGRRLSLQLRNGLRLQEILSAAGPYDLILADDDYFVPLHAILKWDEVTEKS